ncbi:hypothetical protein [Rhabdochlamydiaceae symbiont of Dictyostelium giganteum]|uniref:hypothetical protein n=1 Tax=Rhabdochlamydiaceae symbiont of Dictyostelium giganteum TaxID=3342349 RepID=UPI00384A6D60
MSINNQFNQDPSIKGLTPQLEPLKGPSLSLVSLVLTALTEAPLLLQQTPLVKDRTYELLLKKEELTNQIPHRSLPLEKSATAQNNPSNDNTKLLEAFRLERKELMKPLPRKIDEGLPEMIKDLKHELRSSQRKEFVVHLEYYKNLLNGLEYYYERAKNYTPSSYTEKYLFGSEKERCKELLLEEIRLNPSDEEPYRLLGKLLHPWETIPVGDQGTFGKKELLQKSIEKLPHQAKAYQLLAKEVLTGEKIRLPNGEHLTKIELLVKAHQHEPTNAHVLCDLALLLEPGESVFLSNNKQYTSILLLKEAMQIEPRESRSYRILGEKLFPWAILQLDDGTLIDKYKVLLCFLDLEPFVALGFLKHGNIPTRDNVLTLFNL